jgi:hypothetical protein
MIRPKVTLQGKPGQTYSRVINGKVYKFTAQKPQIVSESMYLVLRNLKNSNGIKLFKTEEVIVLNTIPKKSAPEIVSKKHMGESPDEMKLVLQHVDGNDPDWKQMRFGQCP